MCPLRRCYHYFAARIRRISCSSILSRHNVPHPLALLPPPSCMGTFKKPPQRTTTNAECHKTVDFKEQSNGFALTVYFLINLFLVLCETTTQSDQFKGFMENADATVTFLSLKSLVSPRVRIHFPNSLATY